MGSLRHDVSRYLRTNPMSDSRFGLLSANDNMLLKKLRDGAEMSPGKEARVRKFMTDNPNGVPQKDYRKEVWDQRRIDHGPTGRKPPPSKLNQEDDNAT